MKDSNGIRQLIRFVMNIVHAPFMTMVLTLFNCLIHFKKVMAQMKKKVDRLSLQKLKPTQRGDGVFFWQPTKWNGEYWHYELWLGI
jgi:hypothetical protein